MSLNDCSTTIPRAPISLPIVVQSASANRRPVTLTECRWATAYPEIQKACYLARVCSTLSPKSCRLKDVQPILQEGPTCGLTAISMLLGGRPTAAQLLQSARERKYTRNGEMFSADQLFELLCNSVDAVTTSTKMTLFRGRLDCEQVQQVLRTGGCLLVPYPF